MVIKATRIPKTLLTRYSAWEPCVRLPDGEFDHSTVTSDGAGGWLGKIGTARLPADINAILPGPERAAASLTWYEGEYQRAYEAILETHPELIGVFGIQDMGEIEVDRGST